MRGTEQYCVHTSNGNIILQSRAPCALTHQEAPTTAVPLTRCTSPPGPGGQAAWSPRDAGGRSPGLCPPVPAKRHVHPSPESYRKAILQELNQEERTSPISAGAFPPLQVHWGPSGVWEEAESTHTHYRSTCLWGRIRGSPSDQSCPGRSALKRSAMSPGTRCVGGSPACGLGGQP